MESIGAYDATRGWNKMVNCMAVVISHRTPQDCLVSPTYSENHGSVRSTYPTA